ncbi:MAG TPA: response regulator [Polyangia bacterium]|nr:response regulator [Polyangia bacterium]
MTNSERQDPRRVVVVDDSDGFRSLLQWFLGSLPEVTIVGEARDGEGAIAEVERTKPDLVLMDVCMPKLDGLQTTRRLRTDGQSARIVLLTAYGDTIPRWLAEEVGADDVLDKSNLGDRLREAIVGQGRHVPDPGQGNRKGKGNGKEGV